MNIQPKPIKTAFMEIEMAMEIIKQRIQERLEALGISSFEASEKAGLDRSFLNELLTGKKQMPRPKNMLKIADVLRCDPDYLLGFIDKLRFSPGAPARSEQSTVFLSGIVEGDTWRPDGHKPTGANEPLPMELDPRYDPEAQSVFLVRGDTASKFGISDGALVTIASSEARPVRAEDIAVIKITMAGSVSQYRIVKISDTRDGKFSVENPLADQYADVKLDMTIAGTIVRVTQIL